MPVLGVIPARLGSSRLPRKPLLPLAGEPLILWVLRRVLDSQVCERVVVATDAAEVVATVRAAGGEAVQTAADHRSGTERVAEVVAMPAYSGFDLIVNVQGDEPFVDGAALRGALARVVAGDPIGTAAGRLDAVHAPDPARVKVVLDVEGRALYFSRAAIPFDRDGRGGVEYHQHVGVYAYRRDALLRWVALPPVAEERWEQLEQLRPLRHGLPIGVHIIDAFPARGIDTPDDLAWAEAALSAQLKEVSS